MASCQSQQHLLSYPIIKPAKAWHTPAVTAAAHIPTLGLRDVAHSPAPDETITAPIDIAAICALRNEKKRGGWKEGRRKKKIVRQTRLQNEHAGIEPPRRVVSCQ